MTYEFYLVQFFQKLDNIPDFVFSFCGTLFILKIQILLVLVYLRFCNKLNIDRIIFESSFIFNFLNLYFQKDALQAHICSKHFYQYQGIQFNLFIIVGLM